MKAYLVTNSITREYSVVVFAESPGKAKALVQGTDGFEDDPFTELSAYRKPELDPFYKGHRFMDWDDPDDRVAMVRYGGYVCSDEAKEFEDCKECPAREWCSEAEDEENEEIQNFYDEVLRDYLTSLANEQKNAEDSRKDK